MATHFRFVRDHHKHIKKIGLVTDSALGDVAEHLASHFVSAEIRHFSAGEREAAKQWIKITESWGRLWFALCLYPAVVSQRGWESQMKTPWVFLTAFALVFYGTGAAFMEGFVNYPSWHLVGSAEFTQFHRFISPRILSYLVAPLVLGTVFSILLIWFRPAVIPAWAIWASIALQAIVWVSTVAIQVPIQLRLSADGLSLPLSSV